MDDVTQEVTRSSDVKAQFKTSHVALPLTKLVLQELNLLQELHLGSLLLSNSSNNFKCKLIPMRTINSVRLVSIHWIVDIGVCKVLILIKVIDIVAFILPEWQP